MVSSFVLFAKRILVVLLSSVRFAGVGCIKNIVVLEVN